MSIWVATNTSKFGTTLGQFQPNSVTSPGRQVILLVSGLHEMIVLSAIHLAELGSLQ